MFDSHEHVMLTSQCSTEFKCHDVIAVRGLTITSLEDGMGNFGKK